MSGAVSPVKICMSDMIVILQQKMKEESKMKIRQEGYRHGDAVAPLIKHKSKI